MVFLQCGIRHSSRGAVCEPVPVSFRIAAPLADLGVHVYDLFMIHER